MPELKLNAFQVLLFAVLVGVGGAFAMAGDWSIAWPCAGVAGLLLFCGFAVGHSEESQPSEHGGGDVWDGSEM